MRMIAIRNLFHQLSTTTTTEQTVTCADLWARIKDYFNMEDLELQVSLLVNAISF
jgi:hypothetical protein